MEYTINIKSRILKRVDKMPKRERAAFWDLVLDLRTEGPLQPGWRNYSPLSSTEYHCHLGYHWVACWRHEKGTIEIEVYYAGSRENAPY